MKRITKQKTRIDLRKTGQLLQAFAKEYGYSVKDIQMYLGLACPQPVYRWYKGIIMPSIDNLLRLNELYHVHMEELLVKEEMFFDINLIFESHMNADSLKKRMMAYGMKFAV